MKSKKWAMVRKKRLKIRGTSEMWEASVGGRQENSLRTVHSNC